MSGPSDKAVCPTCGKTGPDTAHWIYDAQMYEADCGDEWHDQFEEGQ